jgi:RimJ/RimL family protein N-acetyltransferase
MTEALNALEKELGKFGFKKIIIDIDDGNIRSENIAKRNGYILEKRLPMASWAKCIGKCDSLIYVKKLTTN